MDCIDRELIPTLIHGTKRCASTTEPVNRRHLNLSYSVSHQGHPLCNETAISAQSFIKGSHEAMVSKRV
jgi:hypothetical protein